jgi:uncharacterized OB-fold protein
VTTASVPIADGLFTWPSDDPKLLGGRCADCGAVAFPVPPSCSRCAGQAIDTVELPSTGTLWTWTIQGFPPKSPPYLLVETPLTFKPYGVGYIDLGEVKVEARLTIADPAVLRIGMPMVLRIIPFAPDEAGNELVTFAFAPQEG